MTIAQIQHLLAFLGYYTAPVDGVWGEQSRAACRAFQSTSGVNADGIPGKNTQNALRQAVSQPEKTDFWDTVPNFSPAEFVCPCGCGLNTVDRDLVRTCQRLRDYFGAAFLISSGPRCPKHNAAVGGVAASRHLSGRAVDFCIAGKSAAQVLPAAQRQPSIRYAYAIDEHYVHMEMP